MLVSWVKKQQAVGKGPCWSTQVARVTEVPYQLALPLYLCWHWRSLQESSTGCWLLGGSSKPRYEPTVYISSAPHPGHTYTAWGTEGRDWPLVAQAGV